MGITSIKLLEPKAREIIGDLVKNCGWRFVSVIDGEASFRYTYFDSLGYELNTTVFIRASADNKKIIVYVNKKDFRSYIRPFFEDIEYDIIELVKDYIEQVSPHILKE